LLISKEPHKRGYANPLLKCVDK